jgi:hypothetical protein
LAGRAAEALAIVAVAAVITAAIAIPVLRAPSERVFGMEIAGRHHDPFTVMQQFDGAPRPAMYWQPFTDAPGGWLARAGGGVAAYNWIVLISFPLAAGAAFLLARYLGLSRAGAALAGLAYAFAPFHIAHAAYHPHIAQVQWVPLYLLALWRCLDRATPAAVALLIAAAAAVTLSNFYGGLIAAIITPAAVIAHVLGNGRSEAGWRHAGVTMAVLAVVAAAGITYARVMAPALCANRGAFAFPPADVARYSATAMSFLTPPVAHPLFGETARRAWQAAGVRDGLLEQQVFLGWTLIALAGVAIVGWLVHRREHSPVPMLLLVGATALFFAIWPPVWLYNALPMFRSYARFGVVLQLMTAIAAGIGFDVLRRHASARWRVAAATAAALVAGEYAVSPAAMSRDVLPTQAHRWVANHRGAIRALDCVPFTAESQSIMKLSGGRIEISGSETDCAEPEFSGKLAADGYTHLIRRGAPENYGRSSVANAGLVIAARFPESEVMAVAAPVPAIYTTGMTGFSPRERDRSWSWRWMGSASAWSVRNASGAPVVATLDIELSAFHALRHLSMDFDGRPVATLDVGQERRTYSVGPLDVSAGDHTLTFRAIEAPLIAKAVLNNGDARALSFALGAWHWTSGVRQ